MSDAVTTVGQLTDVATIRDFVLAGRARLTLVSKRTGTRFTYRVAKARRPPERWFLSYLWRGPSNDSDYTFVGSIMPDMTYQHSPKSTVISSAPAVMAFRWFMELLKKGVISTELEVWHEGKCGRCGRALTVPESIKRGIGPECAGHVAQQRLV